jgi:hypothetical protein
MINMENILIENISQIADLIKDCKWDFISEHLYLSSEIIEECADSLNWELLGEHQIIPDALIIKFIDRINLLTIVRNQSCLNREDVGEEVRRLIKDKLQTRFKVLRWLDGNHQNGAKQLFDYLESSNSEILSRPAFKQRYTEYTESITTEKMCDDLLSVCSADTVFDLSHELENEEYMHNPTILDKFY